VSLLSYGALGALRVLSKAGRLQVVVGNYSSLPRLFAAGRLPCDVGFVQVSLPDGEGNCSLGIGVDYVADALAYTPVLIAEINERMPATKGTTRIPMSRFSAVVHTDRPLLEAPERAPEEDERAIARNVAALIEDGDTVQIGVGSLPAAVLDALSDHTDLGLHSGMISDSVVRLVDKGVITGARKEIDTGLMVTGSALGSGELYQRVPELPVEFRAASYTHAPGVLARLGTFTSINSAIEVDLTGQVGAELRNGVYVGAVGGQSDFSRAAAATGRRSIIALRSRSGSESTITAVLGGVVTTARADVNYVVTEHGTAELTGADLEDRARRLIAVAAPEHRDGLERAMGSKSTMTTGQQKGNSR
jgi:acyl-CoA hydrolase